MALRRGQGQLRVEPLRPDELPPATPGEPARAQRDASGRFLPGNAAGTAKRVKPSVLGALGLDKADPRYRPFARFGARYGAHRRAELAGLHGGAISSGVGGIVESAAQAMAASRFVQALAAEKGDAELFKLASQLASTARQHELAAWELASREAEARPIAVHPSPAAPGNTSRRAELAARLHNAPMAAAAASASSTKQSRSTRQADASAQDGDADHE
jgi:hypothetical protein